MISTVTNGGLGSPGSWYPKSMIDSRMFDSAAKQSNTVYKYNDAEATNKSIHHIKRKSMALMGAS